MALFEPKNVGVSTVPHHLQRYDTVGDYIWSLPREGVYITTSDMGDWRYNMACALHEQIESFLCINDGIREEDIADYDKLYENLRQSIIHNEQTHIEVYGAEMTAKYGCRCTITEDSEPGEDIHAPYHKQHMFADAIERLFIREIGADWGAYTAAVMGLDYYGEHK